MSDDESRRKALATAANVLQFKHRSSAALLKRLAEKDIEEPDAEYAIGRLQELGLLDDYTYATTLIESYSNRGYGRAYIRNALKTKLLEPEIINQALEEFAPNQEKIDRYIQSKLAGKPAEPRLYKKVTAGLFRRGFAWDEIRAAMARYTDLLEEEAFE